MNILFTLHYATHFGENVFLHLSDIGEHVNSGAHEIPLGFVDAHTWSVSIDCAYSAFNYHYSIRNSSGQILREELPIRTISLVEYPNVTELHLVDRWNLANFPEHFLLNKIWHNHSLAVPTAPLKPRPAPHRSELCWWA